MPFVCTPRVLNSTEGRVAVQITDLFPHKTQSNAVITPRFKGPAYLYAHGRDLTETPVVVPNGANQDLGGADQSGLAVYLLTTIEGAGGAILTPNEADTMAGLIIDRMEAGQSLTASDINTILDSVVAGAGLAQGDSFGSVLEILQIVSGYKVYTVTAGTQVQLGVDFDDVGLAVLVPTFFADPADVSRLFTAFEDSSFYVSARKGQLKIAQTRTDAQGNPAPYVVCYADDGSLIQ